MADEADRSALDPAGRVDARARGRWSPCAAPGPRGSGSRRAACRTGCRAAASRSSRPRGRWPGSAPRGSRRCRRTPPSPSGRGALPAERRDAAVVIRRRPRAASRRSAGAGDGMPSPDAARWRHWLQHPVDHHDLLVARDRRAATPRRSRSPRRSTIMSTSRSSPSSRSSSGVNFTCVGPRRPKTCTSVTGEASRPA